MNRKIIVTLVLFSLLASILFTFQPTHAASKTITVPNDYSTINAAVQNAVDGDTIFVKKGTYDEHLIIDKAISLVGEDRDTTIINGNSSGTVVLIQHDNVEVSGFTIKYDESPNAPKSIWMWSTRLAGIHLLSVKNCNIHSNQVLDCGGGIWLYGSSNNIITDNYVARNDYGVRVESSNNTDLERNTVTGNWAGISLISSGNSKLRTNAMMGNTENFAISGDNVNFINDVDSSNLVEGKPIYYWIGVSSRTVPSDAGCVVLVNCLGVTVQGLNLAKNSDGIILVNCMNSFVTNNTITQTNGGITTRNSICDTISQNNINCINAINVNGNGTTITNNNIVATNTGIGTEGCYQTVTDNTVTITQWQGNMIKCSGSYNKIMQNWLNGTSYTYSRIDGPNNLFYENTMLNSYQLNVNSSGGIIAKNDVPGITVTDGSGTTICGNRITQGLGLGIGGHNNLYYANQIENNYYVGADVYGAEGLSSGNTLYHNNFVNNKQQIKNFGGNPSNLWDNGVQGNYWSDYRGVDANGDGIGDTPYLIQAEKFDLSANGIVQAVSGKDNYPLMAPFDVSSVTVDLPTWTYTPPDSITPLTSLNQEPSTTSIPSIDSATPTQPTTNQEPASTPIAKQAEPSSTSTFIVAGIIVAGLLIEAAILYVRRLNHK